MIIKRGNFYFSGSLNILIEWLVVFLKTAGYESHSFTLHTLLCVSPHKNRCQKDYDLFKYREEEKDYSLFIGDKIYHVQ